jgi:predicted nucleic acid-binding Zn ribbon protein
VGDGERRWLTINQVVERLRAAGYDDTGATLRRMVDAGDFGVEGDGWYRTERGKYRMVAAAAVDALIARRRGHSAPS